MSESSTTVQDWRIDRLEKDIAEIKKLVYGILVSVVLMLGGGVLSFLLSNSAA